MLRFVESGAGLLVKGRGGHHGRIDTDGRWVGRFTSASACCTFSPEEMMEITQKCVEIRRQVQSTRNIRKTLLE